MKNVMTLFSADSPYKGGGAKIGGGILCSNSSPTISKCIIRENSAIDFSSGGSFGSGLLDHPCGCGGGIVCLDSSSPIITNCIIRDNETNHKGGGIYCLSSSPTIIPGGVAPYYGAGGVYCYDSFPLITNCTITNNEDYGIHIHSSSSTITNCIFWNNSGPNSYVEIHLESNPENTAVTYCDIEGGFDCSGYDCLGNIDDDPLFIDPNAGNYRLQKDSKCIDAGTNDGSPAEDIDAILRPRNGDNIGEAICDMGAYEHEYFPSHCFACPDHDYGPFRPGKFYTPHSGSFNAGECRIYQFYLTADIPYLFTTCMAGGSFSDNTLFTLYDSSCGQVAENDDYCSLGSQIEYTPPVSGYYYLRISNLSDGPESYTLVYKENSLTELKIMPLGDSITYGNGSTINAGYAGYRRYLYQLLTEEGLGVDFVGSQHARPVWEENCGHNNSGAFRFEWYADLNAGENFPTQSSYTKTAWIKSMGSSLGNDIISGNQENGGHALFAPYIDWDLDPSTAPTKRLAAGHNNNWLTVEDPNDLELNEWYFVAVTFDYDTGEMILYKNGEQVDQTLLQNEADKNIQDATISIGSFGRDKIDLWWQGVIDEVRVYNYSLSPEEIVTLYQGTNINTSGIDPNMVLILYLPMENEWEGEASDVLQDHSGNNLTVISLDDQIDSNMDWDHEGHPGWFAYYDPNIDLNLDPNLDPNLGFYPDMFHNIEQWLEDNPPDVVLLHIGTNDITDIPGYKNGQSATEVANEIEGLLEKIRSVNEDIIVLLAKIINRDAAADPERYIETSELNRQINELAIDKLAKGYKISVVDMENSLDQNDLVDPVHPNDTGYQKMAEAWFSALKNLPAFSTIIVPDDYSTIQGAIDASFNGDQIIVREGIYIEHINFLGKAITVRSIDPNDPDVVAATIIDGNQAGSVVTFNQGEAPNSVLSGFTVRDGKSEIGGGIYCSGSSPTISKCIITENSAIDYLGGFGGFYPPYPVFNKGSGGGIGCYEFSSPIITDSIISGNVANSQGGGICVDSSTPIITNCTISGNWAQEREFTGSYYRPMSTRGGGISCTSSSPSISNCIINGNMSDFPAGIDLFRSSPNIINCTIADNGGGIGYCASSLTITNCILWSNSSELYDYDFLKKEYDPYSTLSVIFSDIQGGYEEGEFNINIEPLFVDSNAGGDYHLQSGSLCIDTGTNSGAPAEDKDCFSRPYDGDDNGEAICDMGAYEYYSGSTHFIVPDDYTTIQEAINASVDGGEITLKQDIYHENIFIFNKAITISSVDASDPNYDPNVVNNTIIDGNMSGSVFYFGHRADVVLNGLTIQNGRATSGGGICCSDSSLTINNCTIRENSADHAGGGICCSDGSSIFFSGYIQDNTAEDGGGIYCANSSLTISGGNIWYNSAKDGGAIKSSNSYLTLDHCSIGDNEADNDGSGIHCVGSSSLSITTGFIYRNNAWAGAGGGICCEDSSLDLINCLLRDNSSNTDGGAISCDSSSPTSLMNCTLSGNTTAGNGGGISCTSSSPAITNCILWGNSNPKIYELNSRPTVTYSCIQNGDYPGGNNISDNPKFVDPNMGRYLLQFGSPCIDMGNDSAAPDEDACGVERPQDGDRDDVAVCDMGAFEYVERHVPNDYFTIQGAIDAARYSYVIVVHPGTYKENIDFLGKAITVTSLDFDDPDVVAATIIDGNQAGNVLTFESGEYPNSVLSGFTIRNGKAEKGGGIYCSGSSPTISNCIITENSAIDYLSFGSLNPWGGGGGFGGYGYPRCGFGGGIVCYNDSFPIITDCTISANSTNAVGGGVSCYASSPTITNCIISKNFGPADQSGAVLQIRNGGVYCNQSSPTITNCTITGNRNCGIFSRDSSPTVNNCILWSNNDSYFLEYGDPSLHNISVTYSDVQGGYEGQGNIDDKPLFIDPNAGDYHLQVGPVISPCIDQEHPVGLLILIWMATIDPSVQGMIWAPMRHARQYPARLL